MQLKITKPDLDRLESEGILPHGAASAAWNELCRQHSDQPQFNTANVIYYFGALVVISAMTWFMTEAWNEFAGGGLFVVAILYATAFWRTGIYLSDRKGLRIPGGLLFVLAVCMTPIAVYDIQRLLGIWPFEQPGTYRDYYHLVQGNWVIIEVATVLAGALAIWRRNFTFLSAPIAFSLWFLSMDLTPILFGTGPFYWDYRKQVSLYFGLAMIVVTYTFDRRTKDDYAFWGYLFGVMTFWGALSSMHSESELAKFLYFLTNVVMIAISVLIQRRVFVIFGALGCLGYFGHLANMVFKDSLMFPFVMCFIGIGIIYLGYAYQRNRQRIDEWVANRVPEKYRHLVPLYRKYGPLSGG